MEGRRGRQQAGTAPVGSSPGNTGDPWSGIVSIRVFVPFQPPRPPARPGHYAKFSHPAGLAIVPVRCSHRNNAVRTVTYGSCIAQQQVLKGALYDVNMSIQRKPMFSESPFDIGVRRQRQIAASGHTASTEGGWTVGRSPRAGTGGRRPDRQRFRRGRGDPLRSRASLDLDSVACIPAVPARCPVAAKSSLQAAVRALGRTSPSVPHASPVEAMSAGGRVRRSASQ